MNSERVIDADHRTTLVPRHVVARHVVLESAEAFVPPDGGVPEVFWRAVSFRRPRRQIEENGFEAVLDERR